MNTLLQPALISALLLGAGEGLLALSVNTLPVCADNEYLIYQAGGLTCTPLGGGGVSLAPGSEPARYTSKPALAVTNGATVEAQVRVTASAGTNAPPSSIGAYIGITTPDPVQSGQVAGVVVDLQTNCLRILERVIDGQWMVRAVLTNMNLSETSHVIRVTQDATRTTVYCDDYYCYDMEQVPSAQGTQMEVGVFGGSTAGADLQRIGLSNDGAFSPAERPFDDIKPPRLAGVTCANPQQIILGFSEDVEPFSAMMVLNYDVSDFAHGDLAVTEAIAGPGPRSVTLTLAQPAAGLVTIRVRSVTDLGLNPVPPGESITCQIASPPVRMTTTSQGPDGVTLVWSNGVGPFVLECRPKLGDYCDPYFCYTKDEGWKTLRRTIAGTATVPTSDDSCFYRLLDLETGLPPLNIVTFKKIHAPGENVPYIVETLGSGELTIKVYDAADANGLNPLFCATTNVIVTDAAVQLPYSFSNMTAAHYVIAVTLTNAGDRVAETAAHFGVRPASLAAVPESVLKTDLRTVNTTMIRTQLTAASTNGSGNASLQLGDHTVHLSNIERINSFEGTPPDQFTGIDSFTANVEGVPGNPTNSRAILTLSPDLPGGNQLNASIWTSRELAVEGGGTAIVQETLMAEPHARHTTNAEPGFHLIYKGSDVITEPDYHHLGPVHSHDGAGGGGGGRAASQPAPAKAKAPPMPAQPRALGAGATDVLYTNIVIKVRVFEHLDLADNAQKTQRTAARKFLIDWWRATMLREFSKVRPRQTTNVVLTVSDVVIESWRDLSTNGYTGSCLTVVQKFDSENRRTNGVLHVLFSTLGSGCGGFAALGQDVQTSWSSLDRDTLSQYDNYGIVGQEFGHNLDWHDTWGIPVVTNLMGVMTTNIVMPHDPHLDREILGYTAYGSGQNIGGMITTYEAVEVSFMGFSYVPNAAVMHTYSPAQRHLAEGLYRNAPPPPPVPVTPLAGASVAPNPNHIFDWCDVPRAVRYRIEVDEDQLFGSPRPKTVTVPSLSQIDFILTTGVNYWRVRAEGAELIGAWSTPIQFTVQ